MNERQDFESHFLKHPEEAQAVIALSTHERGGELISSVETLITRFVILPRAGRLPIALWTMATHLFDVFDAFPYLALTSPAKRSGKTRLLKVLQLVCREPLRFTSPSAAALYRVIQDKKPTLLLDEVEFLTRTNSELTQAITVILNAGFERGCMVPRCGGPKGDKLEYFSVYCPKALARIGRLPETVADRSLAISMQRKRPEDKVERFIYHRAQRETQTLKTGITEMLEAAKDDIRRTYEQCPDLDFIQDREAECWLPLFAVCLVLAPKRLGELRDCALFLGAEKAAADVDDSLPMRLLADILAVWPGGEAHVFTTHLIDLLKALEESPWRTECELTARKLARMVGEFGIKSGTVRVGESTAKGYSLESFKLVWSRYPTPEASQPSQTA